MWSGECVLENSGCGPVDVFWRGSVDVVQWVCSGGEQWVWSSGCVLEGTVGVFWRLLVGVVQWVCSRDDR